MVAPHARRITETVADRTHSARAPVPLSDKLLQQIITRARSEFLPVNLFDCATARSFGVCQGRKRTFAMIETVTAVMGLVSAGIFLAHAFEGYRYRA